VRGLALIAVADGHPLVVPRIRSYLEKELQVDEAKRNRWLAHWTLKALEAIESHLKGEKDTGRYCHGDSVSFADICLAGQVVAATSYFKCDTSGVPTAMRIYGECMKLDAFSRANPMNQPGAAAH
jgi:maleylacetoacetate isomerase/maleylpyruvate isomerase